MRIRVVLNVEVDADDWAEANGLASSSARSVSNDVRRYVLTSAQSLAQLAEVDAQVELGR